MEALPLGLTQGDLEAFMREALAEANAAGVAGEFPVGAILVVDGRVVSRGRARRREKRSELAHAELEALLGGGEALYTGHDRAMIVTTLEPCPMCLGAVVMADVPHIVFAAHDALVQSAQTIESNPYVRRHVESYLGGVPEHESRVLMGRYAPKLLDVVTNGHVASPAKIEPFIASFKTMVPQAGLLADRIDGFLR